MNRSLVTLLQISAAACIGAGGYVLGVHQGVARAAYTQSIPIQEEAKCIAAQDFSCMKDHWIMRAGIVEASAKRSLESWIPTPFNSELSSYITWAQSQPRIVHPVDIQ